MGSCFSKHSHNHRPPSPSSPIPPPPPPQRSHPNHAPPLPHASSPSPSSPKPAFAPSPAPPSSALSLSNASSSIFSADSHPPSCVFAPRTSDPPPLNPHSPTKAPPSSNLPPSPARRRSTHRSEEHPPQEGRFPSSARKQWLSQQAETEVAAARNVPCSDKAANQNLPDRTDQVNADAARNRGGGTAQESVSAAIAVTPRKNSASEVAPHQRPSSPLKRVQSVKDHGSPRLSKNSSLKTSCSPSRVSKHDASIKPHTSQQQQQHYSQKQSSAAAADPLPQFAAHRRRNSRELPAADLAAATTAASIDLIRRPSPPKKAPFIVPSSISAVEQQIGRLSTSVRKPSPTNRENNMQRQSYSAAAESTPRKATTNSNLGVGDDENSASVRNLRWREHSPLRRNLSSSSSSSALQTSAAQLQHHRTPRTSADLSLNPELTHLKDKDAAAVPVSRSRRTHGRAPLREIHETNSNLHAKPGSGLAKQTSKERVSGSMMIKAQDQSSKERVGTTARTRRVSEDDSIVGDSQRREDEEAAAAAAMDEEEEEVAEKLVMSGKSVLSAFKALEEYRSKQQQPPSAAASQHEIPRSSSTKRSGEPFLFPDMQSLLMPGAKEMEIDGLTMPASVSKACSILRAVADLNMGTSAMYSKDMMDELEKPKLASFQFGEGENDRVIVGVKGERMMEGGGG